MAVNAVPVAMLFSDAVLDRTLDELAHEARSAPAGTDSVASLARWDLKAALITALRREGLDVDARRG